MSVLERLDSRFDRLDSKMDFDQVFATLGLSRYQRHLHESKNEYRPGVRKYGGGSAL